MLTGAAIAGFIGSNGSEPERPAVKRKGIILAGIQDILLISTKQDSPRQGWIDRCQIPLNPLH